MEEHILVKGERERERGEKMGGGGVHQDSQMYVVQCSWISIALCLLIQVWSHNLAANV